MLKELFTWIVALLSAPTRTWAVLLKKEEKELQSETEEPKVFLTRFMFPLIGVASIVSFVGVLLAFKGFDVASALKSATLTLCSLLGGFYLASYLLNEIAKGYFKMESNLERCQRFIGYSSSLMIVISMALALLPEFFFLRIFEFYTIYILWEGAEPYMKVEASNRIKFVIIAALLISLTPLLIGWILFALLPGLR